MGTNPAVYTCSTTALALGMPIVAAFLLGIEGGLGKAHEGGMCSWLGMCLARHLLATAAAQMFFGVSSCFQNGSPACSDFLLPVASKS